MQGPSTAAPQRWSFLRNVALLSGGTAVAQALTMLLTPVITRVYGPAQLGQLAMFVDFLNMASTAASLKYELAIVSATRERDAAQLTILSMLFAVPLSALSGLLLYGAIARSILGYSTVPLYAPILMVLAVFCMAAFAALRYWCVREQSFGIVSRAVVLQYGARAATQTILGLASVGTPGLFVGELLGRTVGINSMFRRAWPKLRCHLHAGAKRDLFLLLKRNLKFPLLSLPSSMIDSATIYLTVPLIVWLFGTTTGGHFSLVQKVIALPSALIGSSVADAFHSRIALYARENPKRIRQFFLRTALGLFAASILPSVILLLWGRPLFVLVFGRGWEIAGSMAVAVVPWFVAQLVVSPLSRAVFVLDSQGFKLIYDIVSLIGLIVVAVIARVKSLPALETIWILSAMRTMTYVIYFLVLLRVIQRCPETTYTISPDLRQV